MKNGFAILLLLSLIASSLLSLQCYSNKILPNGGNRPQYPHFSKSYTTFRLPKNAPLRLDAIYLHEETRENGNRASFLRFFSNGQVYWAGGFDSFPEEKDYNNFDCQNSSIGYYKIQMPDPKYNKNISCVEIDLEIYKEGDWDNYWHYKGYLEKSKEQDKFILRLTHMQYGCLLPGVPAVQTDLDEIFLPYVQVDLTNDPDW